MKEEVTSVLKQTQNLPNADKLATLKGQADQLLKMLKNDIVKGVSVADKGYGQRLDTISSEIGDFKARTGSSSREIRASAMTARYGRNQLEISRLRDVMTVGKELIEIEESLKNAPKDLNERTNLFVKTQELLKSFDNTKFENVEIIKGYGYRLRAIDPVSEITDKWLELVTINESEITVPASVGKIVGPIEKLGKLDFFRAKIHPKLIDLVQNSSSLKFENGTLSIVKSQTDFVSSLAALRDFLRHLTQIGLGPGTHQLPELNQSSKLLSAVIETYLKRNVPSDSSKTGPINEAIKIVKSFGKILENIDMSEADQFASQLPKLISKSKVAKTLEEARLLIINKDDDLFSSHTPAQEISESELSSDNRIATYFDYENKAQFQATQYPITKRTAQLWSLMYSNPAAAQMIAILFISMIPEYYYIDLEIDYRKAALYYSDIQWMIGGLSKLTSLGKFESELERIKIVSLVPRLQNSANSIISIHLERIKGEIDEVLTPELPALSKMEDKYMYDKVSKALSRAVFIVNNAANVMSTILPASVSEPLIAQLVNHIGQILETKIIEMEDIPSDLCTPLDKLLTLCDSLPSSADDSVIEDLRFILRSSMLEIVAAFKTSELSLEAGQVRSLIRALFSNTEHRQKALAQIK